MTTAQRFAFDVVELRRYVMRPGRRDDLISLFEREFIESQESCGMVPVGHYRDIDDPDAFVWFRGFPEYAARRRALEAFYLESPAWAAHRTAANETMIDSDNVLLLRSARDGSGFDLDGLIRPNGVPANADESFVAASIFMLDASPHDAFIESFEELALPQLERVATRIAYFVTEERPNNFRHLPVRDERAFVVIGSCKTRNDLDAWTQTFEGQPGETLRLRPAHRSLFR